jgi:hypothetical protein
MKKIKKAVRRNLVKETDHCTANGNYTVTLDDMYLVLFNDYFELKKAAKTVVEHEQEYRAINNLGSVAPDCFQTLANLVKEA